MPTQTIKQKRVMNILEALPPEKLDEVIDFAEYLKKKKEPLQKAKKKTRLFAIPAFHLGRIGKEATDRDKLYREYLDRKFD